MNCLFLLQWIFLIQGLNRGHIGASLVAQTVKHLPAMWETWVWSLSQEDPLEKEMATHSRTLSWKIPRTEEPGRLQSMGSQKSRTRLSNFTFLFSSYIIGRFFIIGATREFQSRTLTDKQGFKKFTSHLSFLRPKKDIWSSKMKKIAYGERCQVRDLQRSFSFRTRNQAWSLKSFCVAEFY